MARKPRFNQDDAAAVPHAAGAARTLAAEIPRLILEARKVAATVIHGTHGRRRAGPGEKFWQYRRFISGEPAHRVDWRRSARDDLLYVREQEWEAAQANGLYEGSEVDRRDGFIHLSAAHQVRATAQKHFSGKADLLLVSVAEGALGQSLKWEASRGGDLFPHIYGALPLSAVTEVIPLPLVNGVHQFPEGFPS